MPTLYKISRTWYLNYTIDGKRIRKKLGRSKKDADLALKDIEVKLTRKEAGLLTQDAKLNEFLEEFHKYSQTNHRPDTTIRYLEVISNFRVFLQAHPRVRKLSQLSTPLFEQYKSHRTNQVRTNTINSEIRMLRAIFNMAVKWGYLRESPTKNVTRLSGMDAKKPRFLGLEEIDIFLKHCPEEYAPLFQTALRTGMRTGELRHLEWTDIDWKRDRIKVRQKDSFLPKTQKSIREIPIDRKLKTILRRLEKQSDNSLVFPNQNGKLYEKRGVYTIFKRIIKRAGLSDITVHDLRDTFASHLIMRGVDLRAVQELLGHASIQTTIKHYAHLTSAHLDEAIKKLPY